jgi:hypothetical protein
MNPIVRWPVALGRSMLLISAPLVACAGVQESRRPRQKRNSWVHSPPLASQFSLFSLLHSLQGKG